jgi:hypothetical protein
LGVKERVAEIILSTKEMVGIAVGAKTEENSMSHGLLALRGECRI